MNNDEIKTWAASRETDDVVAEAIINLARHNPHTAQNIWTNPTREEWLAIWERVTRNGLLDGDDYRWGAGVLGNSYDEGN